MRILPPVLTPWPAVIERRHDPPLARGRHGYRAYRSCLRWEFGFTCPQGDSILSRLLRKAAEVNEPELVDLARLISNAIRRAWRDLKAFEVLPHDAPNDCACGSADLCSIPQVLEDQIIQIDPPYLGESDRALAGSAD